MTAATYNPALYRRMSEPYPDPDSANAAMREFIKDIEAAREKHRIADVLIAVQLSVTYSDGREGRVMTHGHIGDGANAEPLAAYCLGRTQAEHREDMNKFLAGKMTQKTFPI